MGSACLTVQPGVVFGCSVTASTNVGIAMGQNGGITAATGVISAAALRYGDGTAALPALTPLNDTNTGLYSSSADALSVSCGGAASAHFRTTGLQLVNGAAGTPSLNFVANSGTGLFHDGTGIGFAHAGVLAGGARQDFVWGAGGLGSGAAGTGTAYAGFPSCVAGLSGVQRFDSTNLLWRSCNGTRWAPVAHEWGISGMLPAGRATGTNVPIAGATTVYGGFQRSMSTVVMAVGTGAGNMAPKLVRVSDGGVVCAGSLVDCDAAALVRTTTDCSSVTVEPGETLELQVDSSGCTTSPVVNVSVVFGGG